jgi:hypothetical protein
LAAKANEFGTSSRQHPDRGQVYYFVSISTLGSIFDDSEAEVPELMPAANPVVAFQYPVVPAELAPIGTVAAESLPSVMAVAVNPISLDASPQLFTPAAPTVTRDPISVTPVVVESTPVAGSTPQIAADEAPVLTLEPVSLQQAIAESEPTTIESQELASATISPEQTLPADTPMVTILQSDLAKRLDVHSSTIYKRRSEPNFTDWTRNRDPDGTGWGYAIDSKEYYRVDT